MLKPLLLILSTVFFKRSKPPIRHSGSQELHGQPGVRPAPQTRDPQHGEKGQPWCPGGAKGLPTALAAGRGRGKQAGVEAPAGCTRPRGLWRSLRAPHEGRESRGCSPGAPGPTRAWQGVVEARSLPHRLQAWPTDRHDTLPTSSRKMDLNGNLSHQSPPASAGLPALPRCKSPFHWPLGLNFKPCRPAP